MTARFPVLSEEGWNALCERVAGVLDLHRPTPDGRFCNEDGFIWPCRTFRAATIEKGSQP